MFWIIACHSSAFDTGMIIWAVSDLQFVHSYSDEHIIEFGGAKAHAENNRVELMTTKTTHKGQNSLSCIQYMFNIMIYKLIYIVFVPYLVFI